MLECLNVPSSCQSFKASRYYKTATGTCLLIHYPLPGTVIEAVSFQGVACLQKKEKNVSPLTEQDRHKNSGSRTRLFQKRYTAVVEARARHP